VRLALWTAQPERWPGLAAAGDDSVALVCAEDASPLAADLDLYHLRDDPAFAFVLRALVARPGVVLLEQWGLHQLVHAETAGRGDTAGYLREARRCAGARGHFVARQVLRGLGGALLSLIALNDGVLDAALAVIARDAALRARLARVVRDRPLLELSLERDGAAAIVAAALALGRKIGPLPEARLAALEHRREREETVLGRAVAELRPLAREIGLPDLPDEARRAVASLFAVSPQRQRSGR
jgi:hypothetical protein